MSRRLDILTAFETHLNTPLTGPAVPAGLTAHRFVSRTEEKDDLPSIVVYDGGGREEEERGGTLVQYDDMVVCVIRCTCPATTEPDDAIDPFWSYCRAAILADHTLAGAAHKVTALPREATVVREADRIYVTLVQSFGVIYETLRTDPESYS